MRSNVRNLLAISAVLALPLAAVPFQNAEDRIVDGKAERFHELLDAQKAERVAGAMSVDADAVPQPAAAPCTAGFAGPYPCSNVDLAAVVPLAELGGAAGNDSWGWTDPVEGNEIAIVGTGTGVAFVDVTTPTEPVVLGRVNGAGGVQGSGISSGSLWRDVKVNDDHAYIVSEVSGSGMQVFDLTRLRAHYGSHSPVREFEVDAFTEANSSAHNIAINEDTDRAYIVGGDVADGGLFIYDISNPTEPEVIGQFADDGYTHDVQCVVYDGPDADYNGTVGNGNPNDNATPFAPREICFASNEDSVTIVDVTDAADPVQVNKIEYDTAAYTHQGWLTPDKSWFIFNDEVDEQAGTVSNTTTYMVEVSDLDKEFTSDDVKMYSHSSLSTDHNLYVTDDGLIWEANYNQGLRILKEGADGFEQGDLDEIGYFEVDGLADAPHYGDSWNVYPFFESGTVIVSNLGQGLVVLSPNYDALNGDGS